MLQFDTVFAILKVALGFGLVIFIHEFGHFIVARRNGVFVEKFAIGFDFFGAKLATWRSGGTEYVVGAFPVGGYVKMLGQHDIPADEDSAQAMDPRSFQAKTVWQRTCIISAGVIANFLSAFALCYIALLLGHNQAPSQVGTVGYDALDAGLRPGDIITEVAGKDVSSWDELIMTYATQEPGSLVPLVYERDGDRRAVSVKVHRDPSLPINTPDFSAPVELRVGSIGAGLPADRAGLELGDQLLAVDGQPVSSWGEFQRLIQRRPDRDIVLTVGRQVGDDVQRLDLSAHPEARNADLVSPYLLGMEPDQPTEVAFVGEGSPADTAGVKVGDRIT
ncbi:MAG TPA: RIP metalloprotease RseP, partial [Deltaproteobacteria bacterium]|nr:RIP metalloprotease RseP [Deltaproteobacteria bacterium]